jgi:thiosulfate dehydrogenase
MRHPTKTHGWSYAALLGTIVVVLACDPKTATVSDTKPDSGSNGPAAGGMTAIASATFDGKAWTPPAEADIPADSVGNAIRRGLALIRHTTDSLPDFAPGHITCSNCHLQDGRSQYGTPLAGTYARYPRYIPRSGAVITMADRVNFCFTRSLAGNRLPTDSREMADIIAYLAWLSKGVPMGAALPGAEGLPPMKDTLVADLGRGAGVYAAKCQSCHQPDGGGGPLIPALWGPKSYSIGASMSRLERAASFIAHNMPLGLAGTLTPQEAFDVAGYINSHPRPDMPGKEDDWPLGGVPKDVPYDTKSGHKGVNTPSLLPRRAPARTLVPVPPRARSMVAPGNQVQR